LAPDLAAIGETDGRDELVALARGSDDGVAVERVASDECRGLGQSGRRMALGDDHLAALGQKPLGGRPTGWAVTENHDPAAHVDLL
jgi:hypothetical protein